MTPTLPARCKWLHWQLADDCYELYAEFSDLSLPLTRRQFRETVNTSFFRLSNQHAFSSNMQAANRLQKVLKAGKTAFGGWQVRIATVHALHEWQVDAHPRAYLVVTSPASLHEPLA